MKKNIISIIIVLCMLLSMTMLSAFAANTEVEDGIVATVTYEWGGETYTDSYSTLEEALAASLEGDQVLLVESYTLETATEIPSGVQLTIPTAANVNDTLTGNNASGTVTSGFAYVTLTVPEDVTLTVNGTLLVAGNQQSTTKNTGCLTGAYGKIDLEGDLIVNGSLYARGEISGDGAVTVNSGASVYQMLQIADWRGGTATSNSYETVFPFNCYTVSNITADTTYKYGSALYAHYYVYFTVYGIGASTEGDSLVISSSTSDDSLFVINNTDASVMFNGTDAVLYGNVSTGPLTMVFNAVFAQQELTSANLICPIFDLDIVVADGATVTVTDSIKLLPGQSITVNGTLAVNDNEAVYLYTADGYSSTYNYAGWSSSVDTTLTVSESGSVTGTIASTSETLSNTSYATEEAVTTTTTIQESVQSGSSVTYEDVTFYTLTLDK